MVDLPEKKKPVTAEQVLDAMLKSNASELERAEGELRSARSRVDSASGDVLRLRGIRSGMQSAMGLIKGQP